jgi:hypothetical protein
MLPTAKELFAKMVYPEHNKEDAESFIENDLKSGKRLYSANHAIKLAIEFAKLHVEEQKTMISHQMDLRLSDSHTCGAQDIVENSYSIENIQ